MKLPTLVQILTNKINNSDNCSHFITTI